MNREKEHWFDTLRGLENYVLSERARGHYPRFTEDSWSGQKLLDEEGGSNIVRDCKHAERVLQCFLPLSGPKTWCSLLWRPYYTSRRKYLIRTPVAAADEEFEADEGREADEELAADQETDSLIMAAIRGRA
jgi:hypothetical protein